MPLKYVNTHVFCQNFSQCDAFWRRFLRLVVLGNLKCEKRAYFEFAVIIRQLQRRVLGGYVMKVSV